MDDLDKEMKMSFIEEARQLLEAAEQCFLDLESAGDNPEIIENLFRLAHNMKGTSRAVGFGEVAEFTHQLENLLLKLKEGTFKVDSEIADLLLACNDHLKMMVDALSVDLDAHFDSADLIQKIVTKLAGGSIGSTKSGGSHDDANHEAPEDRPEEVEVSSGYPDASAFGEEEPVAESSPVDHVQDSFMPEEAFAVASSPVAVEKVPQAHAEKVSEKPAEKKAAANPQMDESIRVSLNRLEKLGDFIGELVILQTVLNQHRTEIQSPLLQRTVDQLGKLSKEIQDISMSLRMIPLKQTFAKLQRIVRDTSKTLDKEVDLVLEGEHTEVDKTVLEQVSDPLVHIVRNAIDHGLEMPDARVAAGKPKAGKVEIRAFHQGNNLVIEVTDDGKGLDPKRLLVKAAEKGVIRPGTVMSDQEAIQLIFHPGFSTKEQVSEISGRGVGLDVVKTNVERLGGQVHLDSEVGRGSVFKIVLPLTLAIIDGMVVQVGEERYVVPIANVHETVQPRAEDVTFVTGKGELLNLRGQVLPLHRMSALLRMPAGAKTVVKEPSQSIAIIVNSRKQPFAVLVDDILRQQQIVIKKLGAEIRVQKGLAGSAILGDGKPALIIDLNDIVEVSAAAAPKGSSGPRSNMVA